VLFTAYICIAGSAFLLTKDATVLVRPCTIAAIRLSIGGCGLFLLSLLVLGARTTVTTLRKGLSLPTALIGTLNTAVPYSLYAAAAALGVPVWFSAVASGTTPLFALVFTCCIAPENRRASALELAGLATGLSGLTLLALKKQIASGGHSDTPDGASWGAACILLVGVACKALAAVLAQRLLHRPERTGADEHVGCGGPGEQSSANSNPPVSVRPPAPGPLEFALVQTLWGCAAALLLMLVIDGPPTFGGDPPAQIGRLGRWPGAWPALLYLGLASSCLVYVIQFALLQRLGAVRQLTIDYGTPIVGVIEGGMRGDFEGLSAALMALVVGGCVLAASGVGMVHVGSERARQRQAVAQAQAALLAQPLNASGRQP
jgi:drug/metabolite transporter (DMT)-like permease